MLVVIMHLVENNCLNIFLSQIFLVYLLYKQKQKYEHSRIQMQRF
jgi:hypothetical protein